MKVKSNELQTNKFVKFQIDNDLWFELIRLNHQFQANNRELTPEIIQSHFELNENETNLLYFAIFNKDIIHNDINADLNIRKYKSLIKDLETKYKSVLSEYEMSEKRVDFLLNIQNDNIDDYELKITKKKESDREGTAFGILSDIHIEERVEREVVNGLNEYNPEIAKERVNNFFVRLLKLINKERQSIKIDKLVLALLGDNITGYIHEDLKETNFLSPSEATMLVKGILISGIKYLVETGEFKEIIIPCTKGNHGRTTRDKRYGSGYKNSWEWMMYKDIENSFATLGEIDKKYKIVKFLIPKSELVYLEVYDKTIRFGHGDHFKFAGGVGGIAPSMLKWLYRMNEQHYADMTFLGHWHTMLLEPTDNCMLNGSVIGVSSYGVGFGGKGRRPQQIFALLDSKRGFNVRIHIDVE